MPFFRRVLKNNHAESGAAMVSNDVTPLYFVVPFVLVMAALILRVRSASQDTSYMNTAYAALHSPSVRTARNAFDRRVALAVREAKHGCRECEACGFTNVMRATSCVLCGVRLVVVEEENETKSAFRAAWSGRPRLGRTIVLHDSIRQRRIRRRREWTRRLNEKGGLVWHHDEQFRSSASLHLPSYAMQTNGLPSLIDTPEPIADAELPVVASTPSQTSEVVIDVEEPQSPADPQPCKSISDVSSEINSELQNAVVQIQEVSSGDAVHIAYAGASSAGAMSDSAINSELDFPTKLAHFITSMAAVFSHNFGSRDASRRLSMTRDGLLNDSLVAIATMTPQQARSAIRVEFIGEQGIDAGGVYREWLVLVNEQLSKPAAGIFVCVDPQTQVFYLNPHSREVLGEDHLAYVSAAGRLLGRALLEGNGTGFHLALPLLKIILGLPVVFDDLEFFDPESHRSLKWLLDNDGVDALCLDFTVAQKPPTGGTRVVELVAGGQAIDVTDQNKVQFVACKLKYLLFDSVSEQIFAFLKGLHEVVPAELLTMFDAEELDYILAGSDEIDVDDWESHTLTSKNLTSQPCVKNFWKVVRELSQEERRRLLQFATGSTRAPPGGFCALTSYDGKLSLFTLRGVQAKSTRGYLHSHACFNRVDLPMYATLKAMRRAVHAAISSETIGFTTD